MRVDCAGGCLGWIRQAGAMAAAFYADWTAIARRCVERLSLHPSRARRRALVDEFWGYQLSRGLNDRGAERRGGRTGTERIGTDRNRSDRIGSRTLVVMQRGAVSANLRVCGYTVPQLYPVLCIRVRVARPSRARFTCPLHTHNRPLNCTPPDAGAARHGRLGERVVVEHRPRRANRRAQLDAGRTSPPREVGAYVPEEARRANVLLE